MISFELARKLKAAGIAPDNFDDNNWFYNAESDSVIVTYGYTPSVNDIWIPRLDQLLHKLERLGYEWTLTKLEGKYYCVIFSSTEQPDYEKLGLCASPEDTIAEALLSVYSGRNI